MNFNHNATSDLSKLIDDNEKISLNTFVSKLEKASAAYPEDRTLGVMADIASRMSNGKKLLISRAEIKDLYHKLYTRNTKFAELFKSELGAVEKLASAQIYNRESDDNGLTILNKAYDKVVDPILAGALNAAFGNKIKTYTETNSNDANINDVSNVDLAVIKFNSQKETKAYDTNGILFQKTAAEDKNLVVNTPKYKDNEIDSFAKSFDNASGISKFKFGAEKVNLGRTLISNKLNSFNLNNHQISVSGCNENQIIYAVSLNNGRVAFSVPVKIENNKIIDPTILISNAAIESFSIDGIKSLFTKESTDYNTAAVASPLYGLKVSELVQIVRSAMSEQNYAKAEDALNILETSKDDIAYKTAFELYTTGLNGNVSPKKETCNMVVNNKSSKHTLCGHTGLPLHKVCKDKNGNCVPLYRQGMSDTREGAYFMNSKIFF